MISSLMYSLVTINLLEIPGSQFDRKFSFQLLLHSIFSPVAQKVCLLMKFYMTLGVRIVLLICFIQLIHLVHSNVFVFELLQLVHYKSPDRIPRLPYCTITLWGCCICLIKFDITRNIPIIPSYQIYFNFSVIPEKHLTLRDFPFPLLGLIMLSILDTAVHMFGDSFCIPY